MFPEYKNFAEDLNKLERRLISLYYSFAKLEEKDMSPSEREMAQSLKSKFDEVQGYIYDLLKKNPEKNSQIENKKRQAWPLLRQSIDWIRTHGFTNLYYVNDLSEDNELEEAYNALGSEKARLMYDINKQIGLMGSDLELINNLSTYSEAQDQVDAYLESVKEYNAELATFKEEIPFESYGEMKSDLDSLVRAYSEAKTIYADYSDGTRVKKAEEEYLKKKAVFEDVKQSYLGVMSVLNDQKNELANQLNEARDNLRREMEVAKSYDARSARYKKKFDELYDRETELTAEINKGIELHNKLTAMKSDAEVERNNVQHEFYRYEHAAAKPGEDPTFVALRREFAALLRKGADLSDLRKELDEKLNKIGYLTRDVKEKIQTYNDGKRLDAVDDRFKKVFVENNLKDTLDKIEFKNAVEKIYNEMTDKYVALLNLDENGKKEFYSKVKSLGRLREHMKKYNVKLDDKAAEYCEGTLKKHPTLSISKKQMEAYKKTLKELFDKWFNAEQTYAASSTYQQQIDQIEARNSELSIKLKEVQDETLRQQKLFMGESRPGLVAEYTEAIETLSKNIQAKEREILEAQRKYFKAESERKDAHSDYNSIATRAREAKARMERIKKQHEEKSEKVRKFEHFVETSKKLEQKGKELIKNLNLDDNMLCNRDFWRSTRKAIDTEIREFLVTANVGKRAGHTNSDEFEAMRSSLYHLSGYEEWERSGKGALSPDEYMKRLVIVKSAAVDYRLLKDKENFAWGTTMRKTRLDYAKRLENFANRKLEELVDMMQKTNTFNTKLESAKDMLQKPLHGDDPTRVMNEIINRPIKDKCKAEKEKTLFEDYKKQKELESLNNINNQ